MKRISLILLMTLLTLTGLKASGPDSLYVLCLGNSFTYFYDSPKMLESIAASEGHCLIVRAEAVGGYSFYRHLQDLKSISAIEARAYDIVFLQDQSQAAARYGSDKKRYKLIAKDACALVSRVRMYSPEGRIYIERTWAYEGNHIGGFPSVEVFDKYLAQGTQAIAKHAKASVSPIGEAFALCRQERPDIRLFEPDNKHQSASGSYLKSCVNYQLIYHQPFDERVTDCELDPEQAAFLRSLAERVTR